MSSLMLQPVSTIDKMWFPLNSGDDRVHFIQPVAQGLLQKVTAVKVLLEGFHLALVTFHLWASLSNDYSFTFDFGFDFSYEPKCRLDRG